MIALSLLGRECCHLLPLDERELCRALEAMARGAEPDHVLPPLELLLVRDTVMARYNACHMGVPGPTNVLSFPSATPDEAACLIISVDTLQREARAYNQPEQEHLLRLLAHGLGHIAGYVHGVQMDTFCDNILKNIRFQ